MNKTNIAWTDETWNPLTGCTPVSEGCVNCYAEACSKGRLKRFYPNGFHKIQLHPDRLDEPLHRKKPTKIFVCSMSDLFHEDVPDEFIDRVFAVMALAQKHTFMVLTKRADRMHKYFNKTKLSYVTGKHYGVALCFGESDHNRTTVQLKTHSNGSSFPLPNVWLGVTVENKKNDWRINYLLQTPAAKRFVSYEPALGPIKLRLSPGRRRVICPACKSERWQGLGNCSRCGAEAPKGIDWVIAGGETGPGARVCDEDWVQSVYEQCQSVGVPFFFKQTGAVFTPTRKVLDMSNINHRTIINNHWEKQRAWPK